MMRDWITTGTSLPEVSPEIAKSLDAKIGQLQAAIERVIRGKSETVKFALIGLFAGGQSLE